MIPGDVSLTLAPFLPWQAMGVIAFLVAVAIGAMMIVRARGAWWRSLALLALLAALANPTAVIEDRKMLPDVALVVVDESNSQAIGQRKQRTEQAVEHLRDRLGQYKDLELRVVRSGTTATADGTRLFGAIERALADVPKSRVGGVVMITDGQVHDAPTGAPGPEIPGPVHTLLTGERNESDRRLIVEQAPSYGIVGKPLSMTLRIDDGPGVPASLARVDIRRDGGETQSYRIATGSAQKIDFTLDHGGVTLFEIMVEAAGRELTLGNNRAVIAVNGVRDRLRVLLVTGEPHSGERTWRNLLKSDPSVDLIHFTILRPPEAQDFTPVNELSLIAFPIRELFEVKLYNFDLIIFDRYRRRDVLAQVYLDNIVRYVRSGGALMIAVGPTATGPNSLFNSPLGQILPGSPTGLNIEQGYKPKLSETGKRHPVTADLPGAEGDEPSWGRWFRLADTETRRGQVLMTGASDRPLLLLDRVGDGRVAQFMSDQLWLWTRGVENGGPHQELLRRIAHWLMKEPELEENDLKAVVRGDRIEIVRRSIEPGAATVQVTLPSGATQSVTLSEGKGGRSTAIMQVPETGLYHFTDGTTMAIAAVGALNPIEMTDVRTTENLVRVAANATGGEILWLADGLPDLRRVRAGRDAGGRDPTGRGWLGLRANQHYIVTGVTQVPVLPALALFLLALGALLVAWRREGR